jgi:hypothetical protein
MSIGLSNRSLRTGLIAVGIWTAALSGCANFRSPFVSEGPEPRVENCSMIRQATPTQYVCNGKTYTSVQLSDIRNAKSATPPK